jgi:hypothetical protein
MILIGETVQCQDVVKGFAALRRVPDSHQSRLVVEATSLAWSGSGDLLGPDPGEGLNWSGVASTTARAVSPKMEPPESEDSSGSALLSIPPGWATQGVYP